MGLDYTDGCVNFRDVGEFINLIVGRDVLKTNCLFRGGTINYIKEVAEIGNSKTIFNLRKGEDYKVFDCEYFHFPTANKLEKYNTSQKEVQKWLNQIIRKFENKELEYPIFVHCLSGKDRTGIVVATLLLILEIPKKVIIEEYLLSEGEVDVQLITQALDGIADLKKYFNRVDLELVKQNLQNQLLQ